MRGMTDCCACAVIGNAVAAPPSRRMNSRRLIVAPEFETGNCNNPRARLGRGQANGKECPLWVISGHMQRNKACLLYPQQRPQKRISAKDHVRFTPKSGHVHCTSPCLLRANSGHAHNSFGPCEVSSAYRSPPGSRCGPAPVVLRCGPRSRAPS